MRIISFYKPLAGTQYPQLKILTDFSYICLHIAIVRQIFNEFYNDRSLVIDAIYFKMFLSEALYPRSNSVLS